MHSTFVSQAAGVDQSLHRIDKLNSVACRNHRIMYIIV